MTSTTLSLLLAISAGIVIVVRQKAVRYASLAVMVGLSAAAALGFLG